MVWRAQDGFFMVYRQQGVLEKSSEACSAGCHVLKMLQLEWILHRQVASWFIALREAISSLDAWTEFIRDGPDRSSWFSVF